MSAEDLRPGPAGPPGVPATRLRTADAVVSAVALVVAAAVIAMGVLGGVFLLAFLDDCPQPRCSPGGAWTAIVASLAVGAVVGLGGLALSVQRIVRRRTAWPFAVLTLVVCAVAVGVGFVAYRLAVGG